MKLRQSVRPRARVVSVLLVAVLGLSAGAGLAEPGGRQAEGIKVHGHWTIDVRNPDKTLASHHEIENELTYRGAQTLVTLLARRGVLPTWGIELRGAPQTLGPCESDPFGFGTCHIVEPQHPWPDAPNLNRSLILTAAEEPPFLGQPTVTISGSTTAQNDSTIGAVVSLVVYANASGVHGGGFTHRVLNPSIPIRQGQTIQVKVVFNFS